MLVLTFQVGQERLALDVRQICEVVPRVRLQHVASSPTWLAGVFVYRGRVVPVLDLHQLVGVEAGLPQLSTRIVLVPQRIDGEERLLGLLAARVTDIREMSPPVENAPRMAMPGRPDLGAVYIEGGAIIHLVDLDRLLPESYRQHLSLIPRELPA